MNEILFLHIGKPELLDWDGKIEQSAIRKKSVAEAFLTKEGFHGDGVAATQFHGGPDRAVCFYPIEHYTQWEEEFGITLQAPAFGENISARDMTESNVYIGDKYRLGEALIEISQARIPCSKISRNNGIPTLLKRVIETGHTGYFFRVLENGRVYADSPITLVDRTQESFSVLKTNQLYYHDKNNVDSIRELLEVEELAHVWKEELKRGIRQKS